MTWFKVDDSFHSHPKALKAGGMALGLWVRCGSYCAQHLTDGFIPREIVLLYGTKTLAAKLVDAKLWHAVDGGWLMHDYGDYNPTAEKVTAERRSATERQRQAREAAKSRRESRRDSGVTPGGVGVPHGAGEHKTDAALPLRDLGLLASHKTSISGDTPVSRRDNSVSHGPPDPTRPVTNTNPCGAAENLSPDRSRDHEPQPPSIPDPPPGPAVTGPSAADAYRLVDAAIGREHPHTVRTALAIETGALLVVDTDRELIFAALRLWLDKPHLGPRSLPSLVSEAIRMRDRPASKTRASASDTALAEVDAAFAAYENQTITPVLRALPGGA